jgi:predicted phosphatase
MEKTTVIPVCRTQTVQIASILKTERRAGKIFHLVRWDDKEEGWITDDQLDVDKYFHDIQNQKFESNPAEPKSVW